MADMVSPILLEQWKRDEAAAFEGWDFSYIKQRSSQDEPPWSYRQRAGELVRASTSLLDVDTGGGEFLASLAPLAPSTNAIESYAPNVAVARDRLSSHGVTVTGVDVGAAWRFADASFDLILNRHGHLNLAETARCLARGGVFLTQQVGSDNLSELNALLGGGPATENTLSLSKARLQAEGLTIARAERWIGTQRFFDVGALVYFLKVVPWVAPGFGVMAHLPVLEQLQQRVELAGELRFGITRFMIEAQRPMA